MHTGVKVWALGKACVGLSKGGLGSQRYKNGEENTTWRTAVRTTRGGGDQFVKVGIDSCAIF